MRALDEAFHNITLVNELVALLPLSMSAFDELLPYAILEPELWLYTLQSAAGPELLWQYLLDAGRETAMGKCIPFKIVHGASGKCAGSTRFYDIDHSDKSVRIGSTWISKNFQGTGINNAAKWMMLRYAFETLGMNRVEMRVDERNIKSKRAVERLGCTCRYREEDHHHENLTNARVILGYQITYDEWVNLNQTNVFDRFDSDFSLSFPLNSVG